MMILPYIKIIRPIQWLKNLILFFPPFLGGTLFQQQSFFSAVIAFSAFCIASSSVYIFNDINDRDADKQHPVKKLRPLPSCEINIIAAYIFSVILLVAAIYFATLISFKFLIFMLSYLLVSISYSVLLKNFPVIDIFCIASGFIFRLLAGGEVFNIMISEWLFMTVFLLALFLSTGKRYSEKHSLGGIAALHRKSLSAYPNGFLDGVLFMAGSAVLVTYSMYVITRHSSLLLFTVPLCCLGLLRYILRVLSGRSGDPTESLLRDFPLFLVGVCWAVLVGLSVYGR